MTETDHLAAEYALGLLEGQELLRARGMQAHDAAFADAVTRWQEHFGPLLDDVPSAKPRHDLWQSIEAELDEAHAQPSGTVVALKSRVRRWQLVAGASTAVAAVLLAIAVWPAQQALPLPNQSASPLAASIPVGDTGLRLEVTYLSDSQELLVSAAGLTADGVHDHELWVVSEVGSARSLGVVAPGTVTRSALDEALAGQLDDGAELVLTREPLGGAPEGSVAGPVVAQGSLTAI